MLTKPLTDDHIKTLDHRSIPARISTEECPYCKQSSKPGGFNFILVQYDEKRCARCMSVLGQDREILLHDTVSEALAVLIGACRFSVREMKREVVKACGRPVNQTRIELDSTNTKLSPLSARLCWFEIIERCSNPGEVWLPNKREYRFNVHALARSAAYSLGVHNQFRLTDKSVDPEYPGRKFIRMERRDQVQKQVRENGFIGKVVQDPITLVVRLELAWGDSAKTN